MNQTKLERLPSISSCFPERFAGPSPTTEISRQKFSAPSLPLHQLPQPIPPHNSVDKYPIEDQQALPQLPTNLVPPLAAQPSTQTVPVDLTNHASSVSAPSANQLHRKSDPRSLQHLPSLPKIQHVSAPEASNLPSWKKSSIPSSSLPTAQYYPASEAAANPSWKTSSIDLSEWSFASAPATFHHQNKPASSLSEPLPAPLPPLPSFLKGNKKSTRLTLYAPLYQAAMKGDWEKAESFLKSHPGAINVRITKEMDTILHIAAGAKHTKFVEEVVKLMTVSDLALRNKYNNTALCYAAASGVTKIAELMVSRNTNLPLMRNHRGVTPLYIAALFGHRDMVWYLFSVTSDEDLTQEDYTELLITAIRTDLFDVALNIIQHRPELAHRNVKGETALHVLARKPAAFASKSRLGIWDRFVYSSSLSLVPRLARTLQMLVPGIHVVYEKKLMHVQALELVKLIWEQVLALDDSEISAFLGSSSPLFIAAEFGIVEFITELIRSYPDLILKVNEQSRSIFHVAVMYRQEKIFNLIHDIGAHKDMITPCKDVNNANILHLAGRVAPMDQLTVISGAALQMQRELLWFKEVEKNVQPSLKEKKDDAGRTPRMLFIEEHRGLVREGEKWMKNTASSCMLVATLITTVMFAAIFTVPGGNDNNKGIPIFLDSTSFIIFALADALALFSSVTSILMFLSILTSRYAEEDFLELLPKRLVVGLATLFCSIASMLVAFGATFCIVLGHRLAWIVVPVALVFSVPAVVFAFLQFPLFADTIHCSFGSGIFARKSTDMLY